MSPMVTVLMPVYNADAYLREAVGSILNQTFKDFEFLIINDGSTDESAAILESYQDDRIRIINHIQNQKLIATLNEGIRESRGKYIVRMDADDISMPDRIARQVDFMENHPEMGLSGTWFEDFGPEIITRTIRYHLTDTEIRIRHLYQTHIAHPTAIFRKQILDENHLEFNPEYVHGEDYQFWVVLGRYCKMANIPYVLVKKREHPDNISNKYAEIQHATCDRVKRLQFSWMGIEITSEQTALYTRFASPEWNFRPEEMLLLSELLQNIYQANEISKQIEHSQFSVYLAEKWFHLCLNNPYLGRDRMKFFRLLQFRKRYTTPLKLRIRMMLKTLFA